MSQVPASLVSPNEMQKASDLASQAEDDLTVVSTDATEQEKVLAQSLFVQHMATYPAVAAAVGFAASFPVVKVFASNAVPLLMSMRERNKNSAVGKRASPAIQRVDRFGDHVLDRVDRSFPQLRSAQPDDLYNIAARPIKNVRTTASVYGNATRGAFSSRFVRPAKRAVGAARGRYARVYDTHGKALLRSQLDPLVLPLNDRIEGFVLDYIPGTDGLERPDVSNELSRTWRLGRAAVRRAGPAFRDQAAYLAALPAAARSRVREIYQTRRASHSEGRRGTAFTAVGAGRQAATEAVRFVRGQRQNPDETGNYADKAKKGVMVEGEGEGEGIENIEDTIPPINVVDDTLSTGLSDD